VLVIALSLTASKTRIGLSLRAVADDPLAALSVGVRLPAIWRIVWSLAGLVGLIAGLLWGARSGVQFSLTLIVLKAMPVLIIGGFDSIGGAIVGGLIVGAAEKLAEAELGPIIGGGIENWFPYLLAVGFLMVRPSGLFGDRAIERV
jgi:branched-chain amino acid transport system permease protein